MRRRSAGFAAIAASLLMALTVAPSLAAQHGRVVKEQLTVKITNTGGTVWGTVSISPAQTGGKCKKSKCLYKVAKGTHLKFSESATDASAWPFCHWRVNGKVKGSSTSISLTMPSKSAVVSAIYVLPGQCSSNA